MEPHYKEKDGRVNNGNSYSGGAAYVVIVLTTGLIST